MKRVNLKILDSALKDVVGGEFTIQLNDKDTILHLLNKLDETRSGQFFIKKYPEYRSLLHMLWHPVERRFYKHVALSAYTKNNVFWEVRKHPELVLPAGVTIYLGLGLCKSEGEEIVDYETFQRIIQNKL